MTNKKLEKIEEHLNNIEKNTSHICRRIDDHIETIMKEEMDNIDKNEPIKVADHWNCSICNCSHRFYEDAKKCCEGKVDKEKERLKEWIKRDLHYPECWDTEKYPTLLDAVYSVIIWSEFKCQECGKDD